MTSRGLEIPPDQKSFQIRSIRDLVSPEIAIAIATSIRGHTTRHPYPERATSRRLGAMRASADSLRLQKLIADNSEAITTIFNKYGATNPRLFGSVARGDAHADSDIDIMVDIADTKGATIMKLAGISESLRRLLGVRVDVVTASVLRDKISAEAKRDLVTL